MAFNNSVPVTLNGVYNSGTNEITFTLSVYSRNPATQLYDTLASTKIQAIPVPRCSYKRQGGTFIIENNSQDEFQITTGWYDVVNNIHYTSVTSALDAFLDALIAQGSTGSGSMTGAEIVAAIDTELGGTGWQGGGAAGAIELTEAAAKDAIAGMLVPGSLYRVELNGTSDGVGSDFLFIFALLTDNFASSGWYVDFTRANICHIECTFDASGLNIRQGDMSKTVQFEVDSSASTTLDISSVKMYGIIDLSDDTSTAPFEAITGATEGMNFILKSTDSSASLNPSEMSYIQQGYVGIMNLNASDYVEFQAINSGYTVTHINAAYTGGPREYVALLSQSGTDAPVATVLKNTLGGTPTWSYEGGGTYDATLNGAFPVKTALFSGTQTINTPDDVYYAFYRIDDNTVRFISMYSGSTDNGLTSNNSIKIEVYP